VSSAAGQGKGKLAQALAGGRADQVDRPALRQLRRDHLGQLATLRHVDLVQHHQPRAPGQSAVLRQLVLQRVDVGQRVPAGLDGGRVDDVDEDGAALDVPQELQAQPTPLGRAGDQAGHVGDGEGDLARADHAQIGHQGGERVVGDLGAGGRQNRDEGRLASAGEADQPYVGDALELEGDVEDVTGLTEQGEAGSLAPG